MLGTTPLLAKPAEPHNRERGSSPLAAPTVPPPGGQKLYPIYNMTDEREEFMLVGYRFKRVPEYASLLSDMFKRQVITLEHSTGEWVTTQPQQAGRIVQTFTATWEGEGEEPRAFIHRGNTPIVFDLLLLWTLWGGEYVGTGEQLPFRSPSYWGDAMFPDRRTLRRAIETAVKNLKSMDGDKTKELALYPGLFLLMESYLTDVANYQTLFISPLIDLLSSNEDLGQRWSQEQSSRIESFQQAVRAVVECYRGSAEDDPVWRNVVEPFDRGLNRLGSPAAADKLAAFLARSPALSNIKMRKEVLESHARAFNQFRNSTLHYAGLPKDVRLLFQNGRQARIKINADREQMMRALIYYTYAFRDLAMLHFLRIMCVSSSWGEERYEQTLRGFFMEGLYNGHDWVSDSFMKEVDFLVPETPS